MRLIIKTKDGLVNVYWVSFNGKMILGWFSGRWLQTELNIPESLNTDIHFTYPKDGNFHFSYKSRSKDYEEFISVYWDRVKIKSVRGNETTSISKTREEFEENILGHLVQRFKANSLDEVQHYQFPLMAFNVFSGTIKKNEKIDVIIKEKNLQEDDLIVDVSQLDNQMLNICALIRLSTEKSWKIEKATTFLKSFELPNSRTLDLICNILPNEGQAETM